MPLLNFLLMDISVFQWLSNKIKKRKIIDRFLLQTVTYHAMMNLSVRNVTAFGHNLS